jgi:hypothetical protein
MNFNNQPGVSKTPSSALLAVIFGQATPGQQAAIRQPEHAPDLTVPYFALRFVLRTSRCRHFAPVKLALILIEKVKSAHEQANYRTRNCFDRRTTP